MGYSAGTNAPKPRSRGIFLLLACVLFPALIFVSFLPEGGKSALHTMGRFHTVGHVLAFAVAGYIAYRASWSREVRILSFFGVLFVGFGIELGEHLLYWSILEWKDVFTDSIGVVLGTLLALFSSSRR